MRAVFAVGHEAAAMERRASANAFRNRSGGTHGLYTNAFQAAVFSNDIDQAMRLYRDLDASAIMINQHTAFRDDVMPFAGLRESGLGIGGIPYTMEDMQIDKMLVIKSAG